jgi:hypothetical protein
MSEACAGEKRSPPPEAASAPSETSGDQAGAGKRQARTAIGILSRATTDEGDEGDAEVAEALLRSNAAILEQLQQVQSSVAAVSDSDEDDGTAGAKAKKNRWMQPKQSSGPRVGKEFQAEIPSAP